MTKDNIGTEEGDLCGRDGCTGTIEFEEGKDCACHISPPCHYCMDRRLVCDDCGAVVEDEE